MMAESPNRRSSLLIGLHRNSGGQRQLKCQQKMEQKAGQRRLRCHKLEKQESKLLMQRTMDSLKRIVSEESPGTFRASVAKGESLASLGISFSHLGVDDDISECFGIDSSAAVPPAAPIWEESDTSYSTCSFREEQSSEELAYDARPVACEAPHQESSSSLPPQEMVEVAPGHVLPLRRSEETWKAILDGRTIRTPCFLCEQELACVEDAELLACSDCWVFSPIERFDKRKTGHGVCIGVSTTDIQRWIEEATR